MKHLVLFLLLSVALPLAALEGPALADTTQKAQSKADRKAAKAAKTDDSMAAPANFAQPTGTGTVALDFAAVEYFPNLKSKVGVASNLGNEGLDQAISFVKDLGPGLMCGNIEFDHWFKKAGQPQQALLETNAGDAATKPTQTQDKPAPWLATYSKEIGDADISQLYQLTGAPAQYQVASEKKPAIHQAPTDIAAAAKFTADWTAAANHPYPVLWSLWNEPGHTLAEVEKGKDLTGAATFAAESDADFDARQAKQRALAAQTITEMYAVYDAAMRPVIGAYSRFGLASFLAADFNPSKTTPDGKVFFDAVYEDLKALTPKPVVDFLTFNSFNGIYTVPLNGSRAALAGQPPMGPIILTQYAPRSMKVNADGQTTKKSGKTGASPLQTSLQMLDDMAVMLRASDLQTFCLSYWVGAKYGFLNARSGTPVPQVRYDVLKMFMDLPILRTQIDFGTTGLAQAGLNGLAGVNATRAAVLMWNQSGQDLTVPLNVANLPKGAAAGKFTVLTQTDTEPQVVAFDGKTLTMPAQSVAFLSFDAAGADPLARRKTMDTARFLATQSFPERTTVPCTDATRVNGIELCGGTTGTFGFYDSVRAVGYLGKGTGTTDPHLTATYENLPARISVTPTVIGTGAVTLSATFATCGTTITADLTKAPATLDASAVPADCRAGPATLTMTLKGATTGAQAEVYLDANPTAAAALTAAALTLHPAADLSVDEGLVMQTFKD